MESKLIKEINLYDFDLLNNIINNNPKIRKMNSNLQARIIKLIEYINKIIDFRKKPTIFGFKVLKVYSNIIANSESDSVNDLVIDILLREESFF